MFIKWYSLKEFQIKQHITKRQLKILNDVSRGDISITVEHVIVMSYVLFKCVLYFPSFIVMLYRLTKSFYNRYLCNNLLYLYTVCPS